METRNQLAENGFDIIKDLLTINDANEIKMHYLDLRSKGAKPGDKGGNPNDENDPLNKYPRFIDMHNWDERAKILIERFQPLVEDFCGCKVKLFRTMVYFKPPQARGVAFHQDERYSDTKNLTALWLALDKCDELNGCLYIVPKSHTKGLHNVKKIDISQTYFTSEEVDVSNTDLVPVLLEEGDAVIFDGMTVHGSRKNNSDSFRASFIVHYERLSE